MAENRWNEKLRQKMEGYSQTPPKGLWEAVESGLEARRPGPAFHWMWALAAVAAAVLAVLLVWRPGTGSSPAPDALAIVEAPEPSIVVPDEAELYSPLETTAPGAETTVSHPESSENTVPGAETTGLHPESPETTAPQAETDDLLPESSENTSRWAEVNEFKIPEEKPRRRTRRLTASVIGGGIPGHESSTTSGYGLAGGAPRAGLHMAPMAMLGQNKPSTTQTDYSVLFRTGVMVNFSFSEHWGVSAGLSLSSTQANTVTTTGNMEVKSSSSTTYAGIPVQLVYTPWRIGNVDIYASAGPMFEFGFLTRKTEESYISSELISATPSKWNPKEVLWSASVNIGAAWNFWEGGGLFVQPGVSWHFTSADAAPSYYSIHPFNFDISAGFRFTF